MLIDVKEDWSGLGAYSEVNGIYQNLTAVRKFDVHFENDSSVPASRPLIALDQDDIPQLWDVHPYNSWLYVSNRTVEIRSSTLFYITVNYSLMENPLAQPAEFSWSHVDNEEPIDRDIYGNPITNSAGELPDPPITETFHDTLLRVTRNEANFFPVIADGYKNSVNSNTFLGFPPGTVKCTVFEGEITRAATLTYYIVRYEFQIRTKFLNSATECWKKRFMDAGFREKVGTEYEVIKDKDGVPLSEPSLLDGSGKKLAAGATPVFLEFETKQPMDFSFFNMYL